MMHMTNLVTTTPIPGSDNWHTAVITIDPETADELLKGNTGNRKLSPGAVARYSAAMRKGDWKTSPEPLIFAPSGRLLNGQTRLHALKATKTTQKFLCVFGVSESVFSVLDRGRPRSLADAHQMNPELAQIARLLTVAVFDVSRSGSAVADSDFLRVAALIDPFFDVLVKACGTRTRYFSSAAFRAGAIVRLLSGEDVGFVCNLYRHLVLGEFDKLPPAGHAAVRAVMSGSWHASGGQNLQTMNMCRAWNLFQETGQSRKRLPIKDYRNDLDDIRSVLERAAEDSANV